MAPKKAPKTAKSTGEAAVDAPPKRVPIKRAVKSEATVEPEGKKAPKKRAAKAEEPAKEVKVTKKRTAKAEEVVENEKKSAPKKRVAKAEETVENGKGKRAAKPEATVETEGKKAPKKRAAKAEEPAQAEKVTKRKAAKPEEVVENVGKPAPKKRAAKESEPAAVKEKKAKAVPKNATATEWESIDFSCATKNSSGKTANFHITSWNVDGLRAWLKKGGLDILKYDQPEILCLQETKCSEDKVPEEVKEIEGYETFWCSSNKEGYAGVGVLTKIKPINVTYGINSEEHDDEGRSITLEFEKFHLVNVYVPNAGRKLVTLPKRLDWNEAFKAFVKKLDESGKPVIICGDMNVAHAEIDLANPKTNTKNAGFTKEEREGMTDFLGDGYVDTFRELYPEKERAYTFWTYMANARAKNVGWRLDYFIVSKRFMENVCDNVIIPEALGSDHCPIVLWFNI